MLEEMMAFMKTFCTILPGTYFMVLTGEPAAVVEQGAVAAGFDTAFLRIKKVPRHQMPLYISLSTGSLFFIKPAFSKKASSPVKQGELMAMGVPIICNHGVGDTATIVMQYKAGIIVQEFTIPAYVAAAETFKNSVFDPGGIKKGAAAFYSLQRGVQLYSTIYKAIAREQA
jgi:hypothetical protein